MVEKNHGFGQKRMKMPSAPRQRPVFGYEKTGSKKEKGRSRGKKGSDRGPDRGTSGGKGGLSIVMVLSKKKKFR